MSAFPNSGHSSVQVGCPLSANNGHQPDTLPNGHRASPSGQDRLKGWRVHRPALRSAPLGEKIRSQFVGDRLQPWVGFPPSVHPINSVTLDIVSGGGLNGWKEVF